MNFIYEVLVILTLVYNINLNLNMLTK